MKEWGKRLLRGCLLALLMMVGWNAATAAEVPKASFCWTIDGAEISIGLYKADRGSYCLFLPGTLREKDPVVQVTSDTGLIWDGQLYENGSSIPLARYIDSTVSAGYAGGRGLGKVQVMAGSRIPAMFFSIDTAELKRINLGTQYNIRKDAAMVMVSGEGALNAAETIPGFQCHGNSTFYAKKRAFAFQMEHKAALGGMEKNKKWILQANWFDISLIRNQMTLDLYRELGMKSTPDCVQVELYVNGEYYGTYLLTEKIQLKKGRLEITDLEETLEELNGRTAYDKAKWKRGKGVVSTMKWFRLAQEPEDVTGGYLLEIEKPLHFSKMKDGAGFVTDKHMCVVIKEPTHAGKRCVEYIAALVNDFHNAAISRDGISKATGRSYASYIDMESFALKIMIDEFCANYDVRAGSQFMYKDADSVDGLIYAGPGWDYDLCYGNKDDGMHNPLKVDYVFTRSADSSYLPHWLLTHEDFRRTARILYEEKLIPAAEILAGRREPESGSALRSVQAYQDAIRESAEMNFTRWKAGAIPDLWRGSGRNFADAGEFIQSWVNQRLDVMTESWLVD